MRVSGDRLGLAGLGDEALLVVGEVGGDDDERSPDVDGSGAAVQGPGS
jgi:hypothetical protein